jgi:hypothetical protein
MTLPLCIVAFIVQAYILHRYVTLALKEIFVRPFTFAVKLFRLAPERQVPSVGLLSAYLFLSAIIYLASVYGISRYGETYPRLPVRWSFVILASTLGYVDFLASVVLEAFLKRELPYAPAVLLKNFGSALRMTRSRTS